ncbi:MAG TPA: efflux RND transporter periplasmic adaptor subunit [Bryobacteraceae bacterium]|nr:efflux RND transporter periplasmic adaptor subunit [Bryobacteraceae bacterium]
MKLHTFGSRKSILTAIGLTALAMGTLSLAGCGFTTTQANGKKQGGKRGGDGGPAPVVAARVVRKDVPIDVTAVGNVEAYSIISIRPQVNGQLMQVFIQEGDYVRKDEKLVEIDPRPLQAQVAQAEAQLSKDRANLQQAVANLARDAANEKYAREQASRYVSLFEQGVVSKDDRERFASNADSLTQSAQADQAAIESAKAQIQADQASLENIRLQLSFTTIFSPIDGRTGNIAVKAGNIVNGNQTDLVSIAQVEPIYVTFAVPEPRLPEIRRYMGSGVKLPVDAKSLDEAGDGERGELTFIDNNVDATTGTIKLKGTFRNADRKLWPGEYVNVSMHLTLQPNALVVPSPALQTGQDGTYVYVVKEDMTVEMRPVTAGLRVNDILVLDKGVREGETVVIEGQLRLAPGSRVHIQGGSGGEGGVGGGAHLEGAPGTVATPSATSKRGNPPHS